MSFIGACQQLAKNSDSPPLCYCATRRYCKTPQQKKIVTGHDMPRHKIPEAAEMVGKDRKTLYRHMSIGKLSYEIDEDGFRYLETSELIRVYGKIKTPETTGSIDLDKIKATSATDQLLRHLVEEVRLLREENLKQGKQLEDIRQQLADRPLLTHQPEPAKEKAGHSFSSIIQRMKEQTD